MDSIKEIRRWAAEIAGNWNGKESGHEEEMALLATDIIDIIEELEDHIGQLESLDDYAGPTEDEGYEQGS